MLSYNYFLFAEYVQKSAEKNGWFCGGLFLEVHKSKVKEYLASIFKKLYFS